MKGWQNWRVDAEWAAALALVSLGTLLLGALLLPLVIVRMPDDYFIRETPPKRSWAHLHPVQRTLIRVLRNGLGAFLVLIGIAMLVLPGQGLLTILAGLTLLEFPGKRRLELMLVRRRPVLAAVQWIRARAHKPPLKLEP